MNYSTAKPFYVATRVPSPDRFMTVADTTFRWRNPPASDWALCEIPVSLPYGLLRRTLAADGVREIELLIRPGYYFSVTVAPNFGRAVPASCPHDWICQHAAELARAWGCSVYRVRTFGDHFFLALLRHDRFGLKRLYFLGVRLWSSLTSINS